MHHRGVLSQFGRYSAIAKFVIDAGTRARVTDARHPDAQPETVLLNWCDIIKKDCDDRNRGIDNVSLCDGIFGNSTTSTYEVVPNRRRPGQRLNQ